MHCGIRIGATEFLPEKGLQPRHQPRFPKVILRIKLTYMTTITCLVGNVVGEKIVDELQAVENNDVAVACAFVVYDLEQSLKGILKRNNLLNIGILLCQVNQQQQPLYA